MATFIVFGLAFIGIGALVVACVALVRAQKATPVFGEGPLPSEVNISSFLAVSNLIFAPGSSDTRGTIMGKGASPAPTPLPDKARIAVKFSKPMGLIPVSIIVLPIDPDLQGTVSVTWTAEGFLFVQDITKVIPVGVSRPLWTYLVL